MDLYATESETTTIFTSVTTEGKAQGTLLFEGGMLKTFTLACVFHLTRARNAVSGVVSFS